MQIFFDKMAHGRPFLALDGKLYLLRGERGKGGGGQEIAVAYIELGVTPRAPRVSKTKKVDGRLRGERFGKGLVKKGGEEEITIPATILLSSSAFLKRRLEECMKGKGNVNASDPKEEKHSFK